jgi:PilZ domain
MSSHPSDRRGEPRRSAGVVVEIKLDGTFVTCGVSRDASAAGLLLMTQKDLEPGAKVEVRLWFGKQETPFSTSASVVRCERIAPQKAELWSYEVAVALDDRPPGFDAILETLEKHPHGR